MEPDTDFGHTMVDGGKLVCRTPRPRQRQPFRTSRLAQLPVTRTQPVATHKPCMVSSARQAHLQKAVGAKGYLARAVKDIALVHCPSTKGLSDNKWCSFRSFWSDKHQDPMTMSPQFLAEFLLYFRSTDRLKSSTISKYLVAYNSVLAILANWRMTKIPELQALLGSFLHEDQNVILQALRTAPFGPLHSSSLRRRQCF